MAKPVSPKTRRGQADTGNTPLIAKGARYLGKKAAEKALVSSSTGRRITEEIVQNSALTNSIITYGITKIATKSVPGALLVSGGLIAKSLYDRSEKRRKFGRFSKRKAAGAGDKPSNES